MGLEETSGRDRSGTSRPAFATVLIHSPGHATGPTSLPDSYPTRCTPGADPDSRIPPPPPDSNATHAEAPEAVPARAPAPEVPGYEILGQVGGRGGLACRREPSGITVPAPR
jgi:hypothetical protein